jgi:hypothetical protein
VLHFLYFPHRISKDLDLKKHVASFFFSKDSFGKTSLLQLAVPKFDETRHELTENSFHCNL